MATDCASKTNRRPRMTSCSNLTQCLHLKFLQQKKVSFFLQPKQINNVQRAIHNKHLNHFEANSSIHFISTASQSISFLNLPPTHTPSHPSFLFYAFNNSHYPAAIRMSTIQHINNMNEHTYSGTPFQISSISTYRLQYLYLILQFLYNLKP